jgi:hypothetical protein
MAGVCDGREFEMTIELTANPVYEPVSYEGEHCPVHMVQVIPMQGIGLMGVELWDDRNYYDCSLRHAFKTLQSLHASEGRVQLYTLRIVPS